MKNLLYFIGALGGINLVILVHEMGHFLCAQFFGVPTPTFSLGLGPVLLSLPLGKTIFQIALLPFGGYVELDPQTLAAQPYIPKMLIISAGILFNLFFACGILMYDTFLNKTISFFDTLKTNFLQYQSTLRDIYATSELNKSGSFIGPIGIINIMEKSLEVNTQLFWFIIAMISINIAFFNLLPLPFLDGGKALIYTIEAISGTTISPTILWYATIIFLALFIFLITKITINDVKQLCNKQ